MISLRDVDIDSEVSLLLNIGFKVRHLEVVIDPVHYEVREPGRFPWRLEQLVEELEAFLAEVVPEHLETHQGRVVKQTLRQEGEAEIIDIVVCDVQMHQTLVLRDGL